jgi:hypothetical protein
MRVGETVRGVIQKIGSMISGASGWSKLENRPSLV